MGLSDKRSALKRQVHVHSGGGQRRRDGMIRQDVCAQATSSRTGWRREKTRGWDDQTRGLRSSDKFTHSLEEGKDDGMGWDDQTRDLRSSDKLTYSLEEGKEEGMG